MTNTRKRRNITGNALSEYGLVTFLVGTASIGALTVLSTTLSNSLDWLRPYITGNAVKTQQDDLLGPASKNAIQEPSPLPLKSTSSVMKPTGPLNVEDYSPSMSTQVAAIGANGTTSMLSSQLKALAEKLKDEGTITAEGANKIIALADQGFRIAGLEKSIEDMSRKVLSNQDFLNSSIVFDGKTIPMTQVAGLIGFGTPGDCNEDIAANPAYMLDPTYASPETLAFISLYQDALSDPSLKNSPEAQGVISQLSSQITFLSDAITNMIYGANQTNVTLTDLNNSTVSSASNYDSTAICYMGNGCKP